MKRSDALAPLSRDHHAALDAALFLKRATPETAASALERFRAFYARHGERHFEIEEQLLLPALPDDDAEWAAGSERVRREHADLRARAAAAGSDDVEALRELGARLNDHVRFEEREFFPLAEARLAPGELEALGRQIARAEGL
jgi:Hemerythrin HHE cation binding domain